eukprot:8437-Heterococcus_DN1.PRE.4
MIYSEVIKGTIPQGHEGVSGCSVSLQQHQCHTHYTYMSTAVCSSSSSSHTEAAVHVTVMCCTESDRHGLCNEMRRKTTEEFVEDNTGAVIEDDDPLINLERLICDDQLSQFAVYYKRYSDGFLRNDDSQFKQKFCDAYQAMSLIGMQVPSDYVKVAK